MKKLKLELDAMVATAEVEFFAPVESTEPLRLVLSSLIDTLCRQLGQRQHLCARLRLLLVVDGINPHEDAREVRPAPPTADARVLADLCRRALEAPPPDGPLRGLRLEAVDVEAACTG